MKKLFDLTGCLVGFVLPLAVLWAIALPFAIVGGIGRRLIPALLLVGVLVGCQGTTVLQMADGTRFVQAGQLGGKGFVSLKKTPAGGWSYMSRFDGEDSFRNAATAGVAAYTAYQYGLTTRNADTQDAAVALGAQKSTTAVTLGAQKEATAQAAIEALPK